MAEMLLGVAFSWAMVACGPTSGKDNTFKAHETTNTDFTTKFIDTGFRPVFLATADVDGDGSLDLATADRFSDSVTLLTDGLEARHTLAVGLHPTDVVIGNLDGANDLDLVVLCENGTRLSIFLSAGAHRWNETRIELADVSTQVSLVDLNGDGSATLDILVTVTTGNALWALVNNGRGTFTRMVNNTLGAPQRFVSGDWNPGSALDLVVLHPINDRISVLLGDGAGGFVTTPAEGIAVQDNPVRIVSTDINGDGHADIAVSNRFSDRISVLLGDGAGGFSILEELPVNDSPTALAVGTFTGNAGGPRDDLAVVQRNGSSISILLWNDVENSYNVSTLGVSPDPVDLAVGDFNADMIDDIAIVEEDNRVLSILTGAGNGTFTRTVVGFLSVPTFPVVVDLGGNGTDDLLLLQTLSNRVVVLENVH